MKKKSVLMCLSFLGLTLVSCGRDNSNSSKEGSSFSSLPSSSETSSSATLSSSSSSSLRKSYTILWKNGEEILEQDAMYADEATKPSYDGQTPKKESDAQYTYTFDGWTIEGSANVYSEADLPVVSSDITYFAHYASILRYYDVSWQIGDDIVEEDKNLPYGTKPYFDADDVEDEDDFTLLDSYSTEQFEYTFDGWLINGEGEPYLEEDLPVVSGNTNYVAHFKEEVRSFYVCWKNGDYTMESGTFEYGEAPRFNTEIPEKESEDGYTYFFDGWRIGSPQSDRLYTPDTLPPVTEETYYYINYGAIKNTGLDLLTNSSNNAVAIYNDEAYIFKGSESSSQMYSNSIYKWNPVTGTVDTGVTQPLSVCHQAAVECGGLIYLIGGKTATNAALNTIYIYNPATGTVTNSGVTMHTGRCSPRAVALNGIIYITGGYGGSDNASVEAFDTTNNTITDTNMDTDASSGSTMVKSDDDILFLFGRKDIVRGGIYSIDNLTNEVTRMKENVLTSLDYGAAISYKGKIYTIGGTDYSDDINHTRTDSDMVCCYNVDEGTYGDTRIRLPHALTHMSVGVINDRIYVFGGESLSNGVTTYYDDVYEIIP